MAKMDQHEMAEMENKPMMAGNEVCVPMSAVAIADGEDSTAPEPGDQVSVVLEGKVNRVADGHVYFTATTANGEPMPDKPKTEDEMLEAEGESLRDNLMMS